MSGPKVLVLDIETAPLEALVWGLFDQNVALNQITKDRSLLSVAFKWLGESKVSYVGTGGQRDVRDDKRVAKAAWKAMDEADIIVTQNGKKFDEPILKGRFLIHGLGAPSPYKHIDTYQLAKKMGFPSNKLEYLTKTLAPQMAKSDHAKFPGMKLWTECLKGNKAAWKEMEAYNKRDVVGTEAVYLKLRPFGNGGVNFDLYRSSDAPTCHCGSTHFNKRGFAFTPTGKYQIYQCKECGAYTRDSSNLLSKEKRASLKKGM
jgi:hypothetical protein